MQHLRDDILDKAYGAIRRVAPSAIVYRRGPLSCAITAVKGQSKFMVMDTSGVSTARTVTDFIFPASDLILGGAFAEPKAGDVIEEVKDGVKLTCEVRPPSDDEPAWRYSDPARRRFRVHVVKLEAVTL